MEIDIELKIKELEKKYDELHWVLERHYKVLCVLGEEYRKRTESNLDDIVECMYV